MLRKGGSRAGPYEVTKFMFKMQAKARQGNFFRLSERTDHPWLIRCSATNKRHHVQTAIGGMKNVSIHRSMAYRTGRRGTTRHKESTKTQPPDR